MTDTGPARVSRGRTIAARILVVLGILLLVVSLLANYVKREAFDPSSFRNTSEELIANPEIQDQVAAAMVDRLYQNVDVSTELQDQLPSNLKRLSGPIAGISRELVDRAAHELLQRPAVQQLFVDATSVAQKQFIAVIEGNSKVVESTNGNVVLDIRPLVLQLGDRFNFVSNLASRIPPDAAQVTILESNDLETAQNLTHALEVIANWIWVLVVASWAAAIWLVPGRRRREVRAIAIGLIIVGVVVLVIRRLAGNYFVDHIVVTESVRPAASEVWRILTDSLASSAWVAVWVGVAGTAGAWLTGEGRRATASRRWLAPHLRRPEIAYAGFAVLVVIALWLLPVQEWRTSVLLVVFSVIGFEVLRRQIAREVPAAGPVDVAGAVRERFSGIRDSVARHPQSSRTDELERLAKLHADGHITDEEYAAAKAGLLS
jgi:Short C-terminal domain